MKSVVRLSVFGEVVYSLAQIKANLELDPDYIEYMFTGEALFFPFLPLFCLQCYLYGLVKSAAVLSSVIDLLLSVPTGRCPLW